jgi:hypothetical protein
MKLPQDFLYSLLPAFIRNRDFYQRQQLRALMEVLESQQSLLWQDVAALYEDWFIETCDSRVVPRIGELLAIPAGDLASSSALRQRSLVGNTIAYRRRKGVPCALERTLRDGTGWYARVEQLAHRLVASQNLRTLRPNALATVDLRDAAALASLGTAFEQIARIDAVHRLGASRADESSWGPSSEGLATASESLEPGFNLPDLGIYLWRLTAYPLTRVPAFEVADGCYTFHPLGVDTPLFNPPRTPQRPLDPLEPGNLPGHLDGQALQGAIDLLRSGATGGLGPFGSQPALEVLLPGQAEPVPAAAFQILDLGSWQRPAAGTTYTQRSADGTTTEQPVLVAIDPERGRLTLPLGQRVAGAVRVSFSYGFGTDLGGGGYPLASFNAAVDAVEWLGEVRDPASTAEDGPSLVEAQPVTRFPSLAVALEAWRTAAAPRGRLRIHQATQDNAHNLPGTSSHNVPGTSASAPRPAQRVDLTGGRRLLLEAAAPGPAVLLERLQVVGDPRDQGADLTLRNLWLLGGVAASGNLRLTIHHATLAPPTAAPIPGEEPWVALALEGPGLREVAVGNAILGPVRYQGGRNRLVVRDTIVDGGGGPAIASPNVPGTSQGAAPNVPGTLQSHAPNEPGTLQPALVGGGLELELSRVTLLGATSAERILEADAVLFDGTIEVSQTMEGLLRYCYLPPGGRTPRTYRCVPERTALPSSAGTLRPIFLSRRYGTPHYAQLAPKAPGLLRTGSLDGSEIGVFESLHQAQREAALGTLLNEYVPLGLEPRIVYVT